MLSLTVINFCLLSELPAPLTELIHRSILKVYSEVSVSIHNNSLTMNIMKRLWQVSPPLPTLFLYRRLDSLHQ